LKLLLDTHVLLWWLDDNPKLGQAARRAIAGADTVFVSMASLWEVSVKHRIGKLCVCADEIMERLPVEEFDLLAIDVAHLRVVESFRDAPHNDPFDHLIAAQAIVEKARLVSSDRVMKDYGLPVIAA
jgi:PIN domain nuclease of toxin-antitoxin system